MPSVSWGIAFGISAHAHSRRRSGGTIPLGFEVIDGSQERLAQLVRHREEFWFFIGLWFTLVIGSGILVTTTYLLGSLSIDVGRIATDGCYLLFLFITACWQKKTTESQDDTLFVWYLQRQEYWKQSGKAKWHSNGTCQRVVGRECCGVIVVLVLLDMFLFLDTAWPFETNFCVYDAEVKWKP